MWLDRTGLDWGAKDADEVRRTVEVQKNISAAKSNQVKTFCTGKYYFYFVYFPCPVDLGRAKSRFILIHRKTYVYISLEVEDHPVSSRCKYSRIQYTLLPHICNISRFGCRNVVSRSVELLVDLKT